MECLHDFKEATINHCLLADTSFEPLITSTISRLLEGTRKDYCSVCSALLYYYIKSLMVNHLAFQAAKNTTMNYWFCHWFCSHGSLGFHWSKLGQHQDHIKATNDAAINSLDASRLNDMCQANSNGENARYYISNGVLNTGEFCPKLVFGPNLVQSCNIVLF